MIFINNKKPNAELAYGVIGLNNFGRELAISLIKQGREVIVADTDEELVSEMREYTENAYIVKGYDKKTLQQTGIHNCDVAISCISDKTDTCILTAMHLVSFGIPRVIVQTSSEDEAEVLTKLGAEVIFPERDMAVRLARRLEPTEIINYIELSENIDISKVSVPEALVGKTVMEANIRRVYGLNIIALEIGNEIETNIDINHVFSADEKLIVIGDKEKIDKFE